MKVKMTRDLVWETRQDSIYYLTKGGSVGRIIRAYRST